MKEKKTHNYCKFLWIAKSYKRILRGVESVDASQTLNSPTQKKISGDDASPSKCEEISKSGKNQKDGGSNVVTLQAC